MDAILADNELVALGGIESVGAAGGCMPADVSVAGLDDKPLATVVRPALASACPASRPMGVISFDALRTPLGAGQPSAVRLATRLVVRDGVAQHRIDGGGA